MSNRVKIIGIYKIVNRINNKIYIGQSVDVNYRLYIHKRNTKKNKRHPLYASMRKYGLGNFEFIIIEKVDNILLLDEREQYWIKYYKSSNKNYGYNLRLECTNNRGCKYSEETRKRFSERQKRLCLDPKYLENMSQRNKENWNNENYRNSIINKLKKNNEDTKFREQNSERVKKLWQDPEYRTKMLESRKNSETKRVSTIESKKLANSDYAIAILEKRKQTRIKNGTTKIYSIDKDKVIRLYIDENYEAKEVAKIMNLSFGLLAKFLKLNDIKKRKLKIDKVKSSITDAQLHNLCDSVYSKV